MNSAIDPGTYADLKILATARARELGLPTRTLEDWRYVDCAALAAVHPIGDGKVGGSTADILVVDGFFRSLPKEKILGPQPIAIDAIVDAGQIWALSDLGHAADLAMSGLGRTLTLHSHCTGGASGWYLRLVVAPGTTLELDIEHHGDRPARSSSWLALELGRGASVRVREPGTGHAQVRLATLTARVEQDARLEIVCSSSGGALLRSRIEIDLAGPGAEADLAAIDVVAGKRQAHRVTRIIHRAPSTRSRQAIRAVLNDRALASCDALIQVLPGADGTDADLQNRNLLLSHEARADTRPQLDIRADDVKAAHGATIGQLDAEELGYLRCRGLDAGAARGLLVGAFVAEILDRVGKPPAGSTP